MKPVFTFPPKKILVPLDLTDASVDAWKQAKALGASFGAAVEGLWIQEWLYYGQYTPMPVDPEPILADLRRKLGAGDEVKAASGPIEATILAWGRELDYDLIVMGTHHRAGLRRLFEGSVAEIVARSCAIPVMIVSGPPRAIKSVLAPVNFTPYSMEGLRRAGEVALTLGARLTVFNVVENPTYGGPGAMEGERQLLARAVQSLPPGLRVETGDGFGDAAEQIILKAADFDLVVMVAHRKGFVGDTILGTTVERVLRHCAATVLALPAETLAGEKEDLRSKAKQPASRR